MFTYISYHVLTFRKKYMLQHPTIEISTYQYKNNLSILILLFNGLKMTT